MHSLRRTRRMVPRLLMVTTCVSVTAAAVTGTCAPILEAGADELKSQSFEIQYGPSGITSLRRVRDAAETEYVGPNGALGRLVVRYRTAAHGDWKELRDLLPGPAAPGGKSIVFTLGTAQPSLASRASPSAVQGVGGLRGLNDGLVPPQAGAPVFTWSPARGSTQWVQYTFPQEETISRTQVYWTVAPASWRLLYQQDGQWKDVEARGSYGRQVDAFTTVEFAPVKTMALRIEVALSPTAPPGLAEWRVGPDPAIAVPSDLHVTETFALDDATLEWTIALNNPGPRPVEIGDLAVPLNMAERTGARGDIYTKKLLRHALVAGYGSWTYWQRANAVGPFLVMTPDAHTKFEYYDSPGGVFTPYIHARAAVDSARAAGATWRLPVSSLAIAPGETKTYVLRFRWAADVQGVRDALYDAGQFDTTVVPGMVVPSDLPAMVSLRSRHANVSLTAEFPDRTRIEPVAGTRDVYSIRFAHLGENMLTLKYGNGEWASLEFFVTEPIETVISKRAAFLVSHQQLDDPSKWYYGAYSDWDEKNEIRRSPDDRDGLSTWLTDADDDAGNARPAFVASKNVYLPNQVEITSLETYISRYLWGGMQMTDKEKYPYALYGVPNFEANRASADPGRNGQAHVWRIYDYPHIALLYYRMYQIATFYPEKVKYLDAKGYLKRAYGTAAAYWTVPNEIEQWSADAVGTMNEAFIPELIDALDREGQADQARRLRGFWEGKVDRFINHTPNLYGSEFAFDSTGFESTGAFAHYARTHAMATVTAEAAKTFTAFQLALDMADRGWLETTYYQMGSDYRGTLTYLLSYMSQMGGWSILDYGLRFAADPAEYLRLGYASALSSWALVNSGTAESGYGAWFPSRNNDGAAGGGFMPEATGRAWIGKEMRRGAWYYSAEEDVGYCAAIRTHATIVARDPIFGEIAYGGVMTRGRGIDSVIPRDGLRVRFHVVRGEQRLHLEIDHDGFAKEQPVVFADDLSRIEFTLENRSGGAHETGLSIEGLPAGEYDVAVGGHKTASASGGKAQTLSLPVTGATIKVAINKRR